MLDTTGKSQSKRQRRYLKRLRTGKIVINLEIGEHEIDLVIRSGYATEVDTLDRAKLTRAVARLLADAKA